MSRSDTSVASSRILVDLFRKSEMVRNCDKLNQFCHQHGVLEIMFIEVTVCDEA